MQQRAPARAADRLVASDRDPEEARKRSVQHQVRNQRMADAEAPATP
jgi:hypothetical protein